MRKEPKEQAVGAFPCCPVVPVVQGEFTDDDDTGADHNPDSGGRKSYGANDVFEVSCDLV
jgi:hypothetical protein